MEYKNYKDVEDLLDGITWRKPMSKKHLNGFLFDSLVYRYIRAREQMAEYEYLRDQQSSTSPHTEWKTYREIANRDILRFIQILDEAIGEHD